MKKILENGYSMSATDKIAVDNDLIGGLEAWAMKGPKNFVTVKPVKILKTKFGEKLKAAKVKEELPMPATDAGLVSEIIAMEDFEEKKTMPTNLMKPNGKREKNIAILENGIDIEDHEELATNAIWESPDDVIKDLLDNKIAKCRERFVKQWTQKLIDDPETTAFPADEDEFIEFVALRDDYKSREQRESV